MPIKTNEKKIYQESNPPQSPLEQSKERRKLINTKWSTCTQNKWKQSKLKQNKLNSLEKRSTRLRMQDVYKRTCNFRHG